MQRIKKFVEEKNGRDNLDYLEARAKAIELLCQFLNPRNDIEYASEIEEITDALIEAAVLKSSLCKEKKDAVPKN